MFFDRETTVVITKFNNLSELALTNYCQNLGKVVKCFIKSPAQARNKEPYALIKFADALSVNSILSNCNHTINGIHVLMKSYHQEINTSVPTQTLPSLMSINQQQNQIMNNNNNNLQKPATYDQLLQENLTLKYEINTLQHSLNEAQTYSKTAYDTFQALREKFEAEQALSSKLKLEHTAMIESYETRLRQSQAPPLPMQPPPPPPPPSVQTTEKDKVKEEPLDCAPHQANSANYLLEIQVVKDRLEQAQIDLGKCQTENAILNAKLTSREHQFDKRYKELNTQYTRIKKQYDHISACIKDFHSKLYYRKKLKTELKDDNNVKLDGEKNNAIDDGSDDIIEIIMQDEPMVS